MLSSSDNIRGWGLFVFMQGIKEGIKGRFSILRDKGTFLNSSRWIKGRFSILIRGIREDKRTFLNSRTSR